MLKTKACNLAITYSDTMIVLKIVSNTRQCDSILFPVSYLFISKSYDKTYMCDSRKFFIKIYAY